MMKHFENCDAELKVVKTDRNKVLPKNTISVAAEMYI